jgi:hypothetical protein
MPPPIVAIQRVAFEWQEHATSAVLGRLAESHNAFPVGWGIVWNVEDTRGIAEVGQQLTLAAS